MATRFSEGVRRMLVALPTGTGKAVVMAHCHELLEGPTLVLAHRDTLLTQAAEKFQSINPSLYIGIEQGENHASTSCDIVLATTQTFGKLDAIRRTKFWRGFKKIFTDEAHHSPAPSYRNIYEHYGFNCSRERLKNKSKYVDPETAMIGFTATPQRTDNIGLEIVYDEVVYSKPLDEMINLGWLVDIEPIRVFSQTSLDEIKMQHGDFQEGQLSKTVNTQYRNSLVVNGYLQHAPNKKGITFAVDVEHVRELTDLYCRNGVRAELIIGATDQYTRRGVLRRFATGETKMLVGCMVFTEGFDSPDTEVIIMARPTKSQTVYIQQMGRGTRSAVHLPIDSTPDERKALIAASHKPNLLLMDVVDNSKKNSAIMLPTIFGLDKDIKTNKPMVATKSQIQREAPNVDISRVKNIEQLQKLKTEAERVDIFATTKTPEEIKKYSKLAWLKMHDGSYRISPERDEHYILRQNALGKWEGIYETTVSVVDDKLIYHSPKEKVLGEDPTLPGIFTRADAYIERNHAEAMKFLPQEAKSRTKGASPKQLALLRKWNYPYVMDGDKMLAKTADGFVPITSAMASDFIGEKIAGFNRKKYQ